MSKHTPHQSSASVGTIRDQLLGKLGPVAYGQLIKRCKTVSNPASVRSDAVQDLT